MKQRLLIVSTIYFPYQIGGAEISTQLLVEQMSRHYDVRILTHGSCDEDTLVNGITIYRRFFGIGSKVVLYECEQKKSNLFYRVISKLRDIFPNKQASKVFSNILESFKPSFIIYSGGCYRMGRRTLIDVAYKKGIKQIYIIRDPSFLYFKSLYQSVGLIDSFYRKLTKKTLQKIDAAVGITSSVLCSHEKAGYVFKRKYVIPNIINLNKSFFLEPQFKSKNILYVGLLSKNKGVDFLIDSFLKSNNLPNETRLLLVGGMADVIIPNNHRIEYLGKKNSTEVYQLMSENYVVVLPSVWEEAFGRVLAEAPMNSTLAVGSDSGGIPEVLHHDENYIFKSLDEQEMMAKIERILNLCPKDYSSELAIQQSFLHDLSPDSVCGSFINLLNSIAEGE